MANTPISTTQYGKYISLQNMSGSDPNTVTELGAIFLSGALGSEFLRTHATASLPGLTFTTGSATVNRILDEDAMGSDSAGALATQQSIKAYVDAQVSGLDIDSFADGTGATLADTDKLLFSDGGTEKKANMSQIATYVYGETAAAITAGTVDATTDFTIGDTVITDGVITDSGAFEIVGTTLTLDASLDIALEADGGNVTMSDGTTTVFDFNTDDPELKIMDDAQVANYLSIAVGANGATTMTTVDADAAAANLIITADGTVDIDSTGALTLDASENIVLDSDATGSVVFKDGGVEFGRVYTDNGTKGLVLSSSVSNADMFFKGNDGGTQITALKLDMSDAGNATFNGTLTCATSLTIGSAAMSEADLEKLDGITAGAAAVNKAVVLDGSKNIATLGTVGCGAITSTGASTMVSLNVGGTLACDTSFTIDAVVLNATELGYLDSTTAGTSVASKVMVTDSDGDILMPDGDKFELGASSDMQLYHDGTNSYITSKTGALKISTETLSQAVTIGHTTSEVTVADNLTVAGNLTVTGTTITDSVEVISTSSGVLFEGGTNDGHEGTLKSAVAGADVTYTLPNLTGHIPLLAGAASNADVTAAEFALLDGASTRGTTAVADGDAIVSNNGGAMMHTTVQTYQTYFDANSVGGTSMVTVGALGAGSIATGFGAIDNGESNITTGGILKLDANTTAINSTGSLTLGASNNVAIYFNGEDMVLDGAGDSGVSFRVTGSEVAVIDYDGVELVRSGASFRINDTNVLTATTLGSAVVASSLTSVGALVGGSIAAGFGAIDNGESNITTGGILKVDIDGSAINAAGSLTFGAGNDAAVYFNGTDLVVDAPSGAGHSIRVNGTQVGRWHANGLDLSDGTDLTAGAAGGAGVDVKFWADESGTAQYMLWAGDANSDKGALSFGKAASDGYIIDCKAGDGDIRADAFVTYSDERLKTNINAIVNPMEKLQKLCGVSYDLKADGRHDIGFIAQDVQKVVPEVVRDSGDTMGIDYSRLTALLVEAVKSQQVEISTLKDAISQLKK